MFELKQQKDNTIVLKNKQSRKTVKIKLDECYVNVGGSNYQPHNYCEILKDALGKVFTGWRPKGKVAKAKPKARKVIISKWTDKTLIPKWSKMLSKTFQPMWKRLIEGLGEDILSLSKAAYRAKGSKLTVYKWKQFIERVKAAGPYALKDASRYLPATQFFLNTEVNEYAGNRYLAHGRTAVRTQSQDWKDYFSTDGTVYSQLLKTLAAIKYSTRWGVLDSLRTIRLERPVLSRTELFSLVAARPKLHPLIYRSDRKEILKAFKLYNKLEVHNLKANNYGNFEKLWRWLGDYPDDYHGTVTGLVRRCHEWHRQLGDGRRRNRFNNSKYFPEHKTQLPPFDITKLDPRITFLDTVGALNIEGEEMRHCVAGYAEQAVKGESFIFSIKLDKMERATLELDKSFDGWRVGQCHGPRNQKNKASKWAETYFKNFIKKEKLNDVNTSSDRRIA